MKPLRICKLRTAGLASVNSAKFGLVRKDAKGNPRSHQGIDLQAKTGTDVFAIADGLIVGLNLGLDGYGYTLTLKFDGKYAFYAHLSKVLVKVGESVKAGKLIAFTGDTGNAKGMDSIKKGAHLHFEIRTCQNCGLGLTGRLDPLEFITLD